jgi:hypothetical protein
MIQAIAYALTLLTTQPVFCNETLVWDDNPLAIGYVVAVSFEGPDGKLYMYSQEEKTNSAQLLTPYGRKCQVTVGAIYMKDNGDVYTLSSEPFEFEGCRSKRPR